MVSMRAVWRAHALHSLCAWCCQLPIACKLLTAASRCATIVSFVGSPSVACVESDLSSLAIVATNCTTTLYYYTFTMSQFDESKAYATQEDVFFDDGRETELLRFIYDKPNIDEIRGSPEKVLAAVDEFGRTQKYLMNVGEDKGKIVSNLIAEVKPETMVSSP